MEVRTLVDWTRTTPESGWASSYSPFVNETGWKPLGEEERGGSQAGTSLLGITAAPVQPEVRPPGCQEEGLEEQRSVY